MRTITTFHSVNPPQHPAPRSRGYHLYRELKSKRRRIQKKYESWCPRCKTVHDMSNVYPQRRIDKLLPRRMANQIVRQEHEALVGYMDELVEGLKGAQT